MQTQQLGPTDTDFAKAADILARGGLVAFRTETVYGLGADARNEKAVAKIFEAKGRPSFNPLIVHVADQAQARQLAVFNDIADALAETYWPGPLSIVLPLRKGHGLAPNVTAGLPTVAIRVPSNAAALEFLRRSDRPIAAPSANLSGSTSPTRAEHVTADLDGKIDAILDAGTCDVGLESTIVMPTDDGLHLLRHGAITKEELNQKFGTIFEPEQDQDAPSSPGQLLAHYAPRLPLRINATTPAADEYYISFESFDFPKDASEDARLRAFAQRLYGELHRAFVERELLGKSKIAVGPVPNHGIGVAINDRLKRAAKTG